MWVTEFTSMMIACFLRKKNGEADFRAPEKYRNPKDGVYASQNADDKIVFFGECRYAFDLEDLLTASAGILGKGTFGTSYKVILEDATGMVVKRLKEVGVGKRDFGQQMEIIGRIKHENVAELKAYYYSKDEKLHVYDYYTLGSLSQMLHGDNPVPLDWEMRMRIAIGAARGLARIHRENDGKFVHGNIKCSNIFLNTKHYGCVSDHGLTPIMKSTPRLTYPSSGYGAPEVTDTRKATQSSDVYSFGVVLLELLTGKSALRARANGEYIHLVRWIRLTVKEEWTGEVFDVELLRYTGIQEEMVEMLQIGMACVAQLPEDRPKMVDVLRMIENIRQFGTE